MTYYNLESLGFRKHKTGTYLLRIGLSAVSIVWHLMLGVVHFSTGFVVAGARERRLEPSREFRSWELLGHVPGAEPPIVFCHGVGVNLLPYAAWLARRVSGYLEAKGFPTGLLELFSWQFFVWRVLNVSGSR